MAAMMDATGSVLVGIYALVAPAVAMLIAYVGWKEHRQRR